MNICKWARLWMAMAGVLMVPFGLGAQTRAERVVLRAEARPGAEWFELMDTGPFISDTFLSYGPEGAVGALKGVAIKVGEEEEATVVFDTELLRMAAGFDGGVRLAGTPWDGSHGGNSYLPADRGAYYFGTETGPGWALEGDWSDPREAANGPLPREWAKYGGLYRHGDEVVLKYTVGETEVLEKPGYLRVGDAGVLTRSFELGNVERAMELLVSEPIPGDEGAVAKGFGGLGARVLMDRVEAGDWDELVMGGPVAKDTGSGGTFQLVAGPGLDVRNAGDDGVLGSLNDGAGAENADDMERSVWIDGAGKPKFAVDLGKSAALSRVNVYSWHKGGRAPQKYEVWASNAVEQPVIKGAPLVESGWVPVARVDTRHLGAGGKHGVTIHGGEAGLGEWRHLLFVTEKVAGEDAGTFFSEVDVLAEGDEVPAFAVKGGREVRHLLSGAPEGVAMKTGKDGRVVVSIPAGTEACRFVLGYATGGVSAVDLGEAPNLAALTTGGEGIYPETVAVSGILGEGGRPYALDTIPLPKDNPWFSEIRFGAFDFFPDGKRVACSTWNGDVWIADGIDGDLSTVTWKRYASGMYQTLGLKIVDGVVYTQGRDQITRLHDLNGDGEADYYENFNNDVLITPGFHEFSFDLQTDREGNFYFSKAMPVLGGGRGFDPWTPHNGCVLKVSPDGSTLERVAWGLRAPGGVGVGPNGEITTGENEGSWVPRCKISWTEPGKLTFNGVVPSEWDGKEFARTLPGAPEDYDRPLCWLPYFVDNSSGSQLWVPADSSWGPIHRGEMLHFSYGKSSVYRVLRERVDGQVQGGVYRLPIDPACAVMRGGFHPEDGHLYLIGFRGWQTNGGTAFHRVRYTGEATPVPVALHAHANGMIVKFSEALDPEVAEDPQRYAVSKWNYVWGPQYGSGRFSIDHASPEAEALAWEQASKGSHNEIDTVTVRAAKVLGDGKTVFLYVPEMTPAMQMEIKMDLASAEGEAFRETIYNTIHRLGSAFDDHGLDLANLPEIDSGPVGDPGLVMSFAFGSTDDAVVVDRVALTVPEGGEVTPFVNVKNGMGIDTTFSGVLVVEARDDLAFRIEGSGSASLKIDGEVVLEGELPMSSEPVTLSAGSHAIVCSFQGPVGGAGRLRLLWSGSEFVWEPVPPKAFRYTSNPVLESKERIREGRRLFAAVQCLKCHGPEEKLVEGEAMPELLEGLPDFANIGHRLHPGWIEGWVRKPQDFCPSVAPDEAADVAAYLATLQQGVCLPTPNQGAAKAGAALVGERHLGYWVEPLMAEAKHTATGLTQMLMEPARHHGDTTFPDFRLTEAEAEQVTAFIFSEQPKAAALTPGGNVAVGKKVVEQRCLVCHGSGKKARAYEFPAKPLAEMWEEDWMAHGCLSEEEGNAPELGLSIEQKQALLAFQNADSNAGFKSITRFAPHEYAGREMNRLGCYECHSGENELPDILNAGEKLRTDWVANLLHGDVVRVRPWMKARMPAFPSRAEKLATGLAYRQGAPVDEALAAPAADAVKAGAEVAGMTGYACVMCHAAGEQPALQAFEGQGPNLQTAGERLRPDYYHRWMFWPQRMIPTTIMPRYTKDKEHALLETFFEGKAEPQFEAIWAWMRTLRGQEKVKQEPHE